MLHTLAFITLQLVGINIFDSKKKTQKKLTCGRREVASICKRFNEYRTLHWETMPTFTIIIISNSVMILAH